MPFLAAAPALAGAAGTAAAAVPAAATAAGALGSGLAAAAPAAAGLAASAAPAAAGALGTAASAAPALSQIGGGMMAGAAEPLGAFGAGAGMPGASPVLGSGMGAGGSGVLGSSEVLGMPAAPTGFGSSLPSSGNLGTSPELGYGTAGGTPTYSGGGLMGPSQGQFAGAGPSGSPMPKASMWESIQPYLKEGKNAMDMVGQLDKMGKRKKFGMSDVMSDMDALGSSYDKMGSFMGAAGQDNTYGRPSSPSSSLPSEVQKYLLEQMKRGS